MFLAQMARNDDDLPLEDSVVVDIAPFTVSIRQKNRTAGTACATARFTCSRRQIAVPDPGRLGQRNVVGAGAAAPGAEQSADTRRIGIRASSSTRVTGTDWSTSVSRTVFPGPMPRRDLDAHVRLEVGHVVFDLLEHLADHAQATRLPQQHETH